MPLNSNGSAWSLSAWLPIVLLVAGLLVSGSMGVAQDSGARDASLPTESVVPAIDHELLSVTHDARTGLRSMGVCEEEREAYYQILDIARRTSYQAQKAAAREFRQERQAAANAPPIRDASAGEFPTFVDLFRNEESYHGRLVTLRGHVRLWQTMPAGENDYGIETLYEVWLYTDDSQGHPAVIVCTELPEGLPQVPGDVELLDHVSATGYFFKMYGYRAQDLPRFAPMLLAQRVEWTPPPPPPPPLISQEFVVAGVVLAMGALIIVLWQVGRRDRRFRKRHAQTDAEAPDFSNL